MFSPKSLLVLVLTFGSLIYFELIFVCTIKVLMMTKHAILDQNSQPGLGPSEWRKGE